MPWAASGVYPLSEASVVLNAPAKSGVYTISGLHRLNGAPTCLYIGETENILAQLIQHLHAADSCLPTFRALTFSYELVARVAMSLRSAELVRQLRPICNGRWA